MSGKSKFDVNNLLIANRFRIQQYIGGGSFGEIFRGIRISTNEPIAIKMELANSKFPQLRFELKLYQSVNPNNDAVGIPAVYWYGVEGDYNCLVMDVLGPSLENLHSFCGKRFSFKTTMILAAQMLNRLEYLHSQGFIHRDIKPDNFLMGVGATSHIVYMIDFGLAKRYTCAKTGNHIPHKDGKSLTGTARYCSINTHCGIEQSRRDDLDAVGYMLVYFLKGRLPWQEMPQAVNKQQRYDRIMDKKLGTSPEQLCSGIHQPEVLAFLRYCRSLGFSDTPDYVGWRKVFLEAIKSEGLKFDYLFDWHLDKSTGMAVAGTRSHHLMQPPNPLAAMAKAHSERVMALNKGATGHQSSQQAGGGGGARLVGEHMDLHPKGYGTVTTFAHLYSPQGTPNVPGASPAANGGAGGLGGSRSVVGGVGAMSMSNGSFGNSICGGNVSTHQADLRPTLGTNESDRLTLTGFPRYSAVIPPNHHIPNATNMFYSQFVPHEPFVIARTAYMRGDDGGGGGGGDASSGDEGAYNRSGGEGMMGTSQSNQMSPVAQQHNTAHYAGAQHSNNNNHNNSTTHHHNSHYTRSPQLQPLGMSGRDAPNPPNLSPRMAGGGLHTSVRK